MGFKWSQVQILLPRPFLKLMRRAIEIKFNDDSSKFLELSKATTLRSDLGMIHIDKLKDGTWRLMYSEDIIKDFSKIDFFKIIRE